MYCVLFYLSTIFCSFNSSSAAGVPYKSKTVPHIQRVFWTNQMSAHFLCQRRRKRQCFPRFLGGGKIKGVWVTDPDKCSSPWPKPRRTIIFAQFFGSLYSWNRSKEKLSLVATQVDVPYRKPLCQERPRRNMLCPNRPRQKVPMSKISCI